MNRDFNEMLDPLRRMPPRNPGKAADGRRAFLRRAEVLSAEIPAAIPVSETPFQRLNGWISGIINPFRRKERVQMFSILTALVVAVTFVIGGAGATVYAAQGSLPDEALYPVKMFSEEMRVNLAADPQSQVKLLLNFADQRVEEMAALLSQGEPVPQAVQERLQQQLEYALKTTARLDGDKMLQLMAASRLRMSNQLRILSQLQLGDPVQGAQTQQQVQALIQGQLQQLELGLKDPQQFQSQYQNQFQHQFQYQQGVTTTITGTLPVSGTFGAQNQFQYQQGVSGTITGTLPITGTPGLQYGPAGPEYQPGPDAGPGAGPGPGGEDAGSGTNPVDPGSDGGAGGDEGNGGGEPDHDQDAYNSGDNGNAGGSDNGGGSDSGGGTNGGGGGDSGGSGGGGGGN